MPDPQNPSDDDRLRPIDALSVGSNTDELAEVDSTIEEIESSTTDNDTSAPYQSAKGGSTSGDGVIVFDVYRGRVPSASELERIAKIDPTFPGRLIGMAERELVLGEDELKRRHDRARRRAKTHDRALDLAKLQGDQYHTRQMTGKVLGVVVIMLVLGFSIYCFEKGWNWGGGISLSGLAILVGIVVTSRWNNRKASTEDKEE